MSKLIVSAEQALAFLLEAFKHKTELHSTAFQFHGLKEHNGIFTVSDITWFDEDLLIEVAQNIQYQSTQE